MDITNIFGNISKEAFRVTINKLLNDCFIVKKCEETKSDYYFIIQNKEAFKEVLDLIGYDLVILEDEGVIAVTNTTGTGRIHFSKLESILLLIIRLLYIEKKSSITLGKEAIVLLDEIYDKYNMLQLKRPQGILIQNALGRFRRMHLIQPLDRVDAKNPGLRIQIYPSITLAITSMSLESMYQVALEKLEQFAAGGINNDDEDTVLEETDEY